MSKLQFSSVEFHRFKAFKHFTLKLRHFNVLVGPNNAGKSTILAAFRILAAAMRKAGSRKAEVVQGRSGPALGYIVDLSAISVAEENIFHNYDDSEAAYVRFTLSNGHELVLDFPEHHSCQLRAITKHGRAVETPGSFRSQFDCQIGFVPILGPVEHNEPLYEKEAARLALFNYHAARNFRNIWYHYPEKFDKFREILQQTWPGMDILPPEREMSHERPRLHMFCPEGRIPREIFWAGFGFQVWCQMLTHLVQSDGASLFLIDEPDIYLHSELQRQLLALLRNLGPDILLATHSTEIVSEAEPDDIVLIEKHQRNAKRIKQPSQLIEVFAALGSNLNPILTQLAKTRRAVFVEGTDFQIISRFAMKCEQPKVANRIEFAVIPAQGFNPERIRNLKAGMEFTLGTSILAAAVFDRDFRSGIEKQRIISECKKFCDFSLMHDEKEIENFVLVPVAIDRAVARRLAERAKRTGAKYEFNGCARQILQEFAAERKNYIVAQFLARRKAFERLNSPKLDEATVNEAALKEFEAAWQDEPARLRAIPGKEALSAINNYLQGQFNISISSMAIIEAIKFEEIPIGMVELVSKLADFSAKSI